jgi:hypothetical protein
MSITKLPLTYTDASLESQTLRAIAVNLRERAVAAREDAVASRERTLGARALECGDKLFRNGDASGHAAAFSFIKISAESGDSEAKVRMGEMLYV